MTFCADSAGPRRHAARPQPGRLQARPRPPGVVDARHGAQRHPDLLDHQPGRRPRPDGDRPHDDLAGVELGQRGPDRGQLRQPDQLASFAAVTSGSAADLTWSVNGDSQGKANGGPTNWNFTWDFTKSGADPNNIVYYDCKYFIQADGFDAEGRAGAPRILTVVLNRREPYRAGRRRRRAATARATASTSTGPRTPSATSSATGSIAARSAGRAGDPGQLPGPGRAGPERHDQGLVRGRDGARDRAALLHASSASTRSRPARCARARRARRPACPPAAATACRRCPPDITTLPRRPGRLPRAGRRRRARPARSSSAGIPSTDSDGTVASYRIYRDGTAYANRWDDFFPAASGGLLAWLEYAPGDRLAHLLRQRRGQRLRRVGPERPGDRAMSAPTHAARRGRHDARRGPARLAC